jgi:Fe-S cluster assembly protein SufB
MTTTAHPELEGLERYKFGWADSDVAGESARRGLSEKVVRDISATGADASRPTSPSCG